MEIIRIAHTDFELVIVSKRAEAAFRRAQKKQAGILTATSYSVNEGAVSLYNFESRQLAPLGHDAAHPVFFENTDYLVSITFKNKELIQSPFVCSKLKSVENKFFYQEKAGFLVGSINFGNDLGKSHLIIRYTKGNQPTEIRFQFEVFPTKLNYKSDNETILSDIDREYPQLVLALLKKTYMSFTTGDSPNTDLVWWQIFCGLYNDFIHASQFILNKPHSRIIRQAKYVKADRIHKWSSRLEEEYVQYKHLPNKYYCIEDQTLSTDTSENRFFKYAAARTLVRYKKVRTFIEQRFPDKITDRFKDELAAIEHQLENISAHPFFRTVGNFRGIRQESPVLQKATGYSTVYKCWIMLNSGLKFLEGIQKIELKNIATLYQIWCFFEIKNVLQYLLNKPVPDEIELAEIQADDLELHLKRGERSRVSFHLPHGERIDLFHDFSYDTSDAHEVRSFTVDQRPDIVLKITRNDLKDNYAITYLYDAKYRLASDIREVSPDLPPAADINQMHRYRDAIYYVNKDKGKPEKEIIGAYVLFPGAGDIEAIKQQDYYTAIASVNIGAFPLRPNDHTNRTLLEEHLKDIIAQDTASALNEVTPQKEMVYASSNPDVLVGFVPSEAHAACFENSDTPFYFSGPNKPSKFGFDNLKYFAPFIKEKGVKEYYEIISYDIIPRDEIQYAPKGKNGDRSERLVIWLGKRIDIAQGTYLKISRSIGSIPPYRYTTLKNIRTPVAGKIEVE